MNARRTVSYLLAPLLLLVGLLTACSGGGGGTAAQSADGRLTIKFQPAAINMTFLSQLWAEQAGYFTQEGLDVQMLPVISDANLVAQSVLNGDADMASTSTSGLLALRSAGRDVVSVGVSAQSPVTVLELSNDAAARSGVAPDAPVANKIKALKGMTIGLPAPNSASELLLRTSLKSVGMDPDRDVTFTNITGSGPEGLVVALREKKVDGIAIGLPESVVGAATGEAKVWINYPSNEDPANKDMPFNDFITSAKFAKNNPEALKRFLKAMWHSVTDLRNDPAKVRTALKDKWFPNLDPTVYEFAFDTARPAFTQGLVPQEGPFQNALRAFNLTRDAPARIAFADAYVPTFAAETQPPSGGR